MISTLHIKNIGIIDDVTIDLDNGLNILTGETGAGKTLIVDSLGIIAGGRFSKEMIRRGENNSFVELCLYLPENENAIDGNIIVSREINANGRNSCKINGRLVTVNELKEFMKNIIDIHGQFDNQTLMDKTYHTKYLDKFVGKELEELKEKYIELYSRYKELTLKLQNNYGDDKEKQRKLDLLKYQLNEIEAANLKIGEEEKLEEQRKLMMNSEKVSENLNNVDVNLNEGAIEIISESIRALEKISTIDEKYNEKLVELKNIYYEVQELARDVSNLKEDVYFDENERNEIETRCDVIYSLKRKYGNSIEEIIKYKEDIDKEINRIENLEEENLKIKDEIKKIKVNMLNFAEKITELRIKYSSELNEKINKQLYDLDMKNAKFNANIVKEEEFSINGLSHIEFMISTNAGEENKPLGKIASGGEMSRIMLAIKTVLADIDEVPVLIFDEVDTGISGKTANVVGQKLKMISKKHQVLVVTHLASVAAKGEHNYYIYKETTENKTRTKIQKLTEEETIKEIARIASGDITEITLSHAKALRNSAA